MGRPERTQTLKPPADPGADSVAESAAADALDKEDEFLDRMRARVARTWLTYALIAVCAAVFLVELCYSQSIWSARSDVLLAMGADYGPRVQAGEKWRLPASVFLHGNVLHIVLNMLALWQVGYFIERIHGRAGMLMVFLACGVTGALASIWWRAEGFSVGASGAIFGLYGALLVWLLLHRQQIPQGIFRLLRSGTLTFIGYTIVIGLALPFIGHTFFKGIALPGIDNAAHIGGLLCGLLLGLGMPAPMTQPPGQQWRNLSTWAALIMAVAAAAVLWRTAPQIAVIWQQQHVEFSQVAREFAQHDAQLEQQVQRLMRQVQTRQTAPSDAARKLDENLLPDWQTQIDRLAALSIAPADRGKHQALMRYASLHHLALQMLSRALMTGQQYWLRLAAQRQQEAEAALLGSRPDSARQLR